jgi:hypothetical protein
MTAERRRHERRGLKRNVAMIGREFRKRLRLLQGRSETITTRFELTDAGRLVEHVSLETHDRRTGRVDTRLVPFERRKDSQLS